MYVYVEITADCQQSKTTGKYIDLLDCDKKSWALTNEKSDPFLLVSLTLSHRYIADRWACCLCHAAVRHSSWIIHILRSRGAERDRPYKAKLIKVVVLKVCLCLFQEERKERSTVIPFLSPRLYHSSPRLPPFLASLIPLFPWLSQENYNLTAHFNISASKWVWQALLCVALFPPSSFLCPYLYPSTHPSLFLPHPPLVVCLSFPPTVQLLPCDGRERERWKKTKTNQAQTAQAALPGYQAVSLGLSVSSVTHTRPWTYNEERYRFTLMYATHIQA